MAPYGSTRHPALTNVVLPPSEYASTEAIMHRVKTIVEALQSIKSCERVQVLKAAFILLGDSDVKLQDPPAKRGA